MFQYFNFYVKDYNIYISLAKYNYMPKFTYNLKTRSEETRVFFDLEAENEIFSYDMLLDFDSKDISEYSKMIKEIEWVLKTFDEENICYSVLPSGNNFQIVIPDNNFDTRKIFKRLDEKSYNYRILKIVKNLKKRLNLTTLDLSGIGHLFKIMKCPYTLVGDKVVLPIENFENFSYNDVFYKTVRKNIDLRDRGLCLKNDNGIDQNHKNFENFVEKYYLEVD
jgi:hypothetical protein